MGVMRFSNVKIKINAQMTVELAVCIPVVIVIAVIAMNSVLFFSECAAYDNAFREAVRLCATSPSFGQERSDSLRKVEEHMDQLFSDDDSQSSVEMRSVSGGHVAFTGTLELVPTLFGMGLRPQVFGVDLPNVSHSVSITVDSYKPGVML